jgi:hypothetical protein
MTTLLTRDVYANTRLSIYDSPSFDAVPKRPKSRYLYTDNLVFSSMNQTCQRSKIGSIPGEKLDVKSIWETEPRGPDYVPTFYCSPTVITETKTFRFHSSIDSNS